MSTFDIINKDMYKKKNYFGGSSVAHVDCGLMPCPVNKLQICSRILCQPGTQLDDNGNCALCPTTPTLSTYKNAFASMTPVTTSFYSMDVIKCTDCNSVAYNYIGEIGDPNRNPPQLPSPAAINPLAVPPNPKTVVRKATGKVRLPAYVNDPSDRQTCNIATCTPGSFRSDITKKMGDCSVCKVGQYRNVAVSVSVQNEEVQLKRYTTISNNELTTNALVIELKSPTLKDASKISKVILLLYNTMQLLFEQYVLTFNLFESIFFINYIYCHLFFLFYHLNNLMQFTSLICKIEKNHLVLTAQKIAVANFEYFQQTYQLYQFKCHLVQMQNRLFIGKIRSKNCPNQNLYYNCTSYIIEM